MNEQRLQPRPECGTQHDTDCTSSPYSTINSMGPNPGSIDDGERTTTFSNTIPIDWSDDSSGRPSCTPNTAQKTGNPIFNRLIDGIDLLKDIHALHSVMHHLSDGCATYTVLGFRAEYGRFENRRGENRGSHVWYNARLSRMSR